MQWSVCVHVKCVHCVVCGTRRREGGVARTTGAASGQPIARATVTNLAEEKAKMTGDGGTQALATGIRIVLTRILVTTVIYLLIRVQLVSNQPPRAVSHPSVWILGWGDS